MSELSFDLVGWLNPADGDAAQRATMGSLRILAGEHLQVPLTEVDDTIGQTVRSHINVPLSSLAEWLIVHWWRLRWEGPRKASRAWREAHCLASVGGDYAWPALELSSDGEFIHLEMRAETSPDVSAIRYLRDVALDIPAQDFEVAVDRLLDLVETRLASTLSGYRSFSELRAELSDERGRPSTARMCRWQALAGADPGTEPEAWLDAVKVLVDETGGRAGDEILAVMPDLGGDIRTADDVVHAMKRSSTAVDLTWVRPVTDPAARELPWQRGARLARELRMKLKLGDGPLDDRTLSDLFKTQLPFAGPPTKGPLMGGFRNGVADGRTHIIWPSKHPERQRFYLARMVGAASVLPPDEHVVPVTDSNSALQKLERSFAQEFLCPWAALDAFTDEHGVDDDALMEAAEHFHVSEWLIRTTLVNRKKVSREFLPPQT